MDPIIIKNVRRILCQPQHQRDDQDSEKRAKDSFKNRMPCESCLNYFQHSYCLHRKCVILIIHLVVLRHE